MSYRKISEFLEEEHGYSVSFKSVERILKDIDWMKKWFAFADTNAEALKRTMPILGYEWPRLGKVDGTVATFEVKGLAKDGSVLELDRRYNGTSSARATRSPAEK